MKGLIWGVILTVLALAVGGILLARSGRVDLTADQKPSWLENMLAGSAADASVEQHAPKVKNPLPADEETLLAGARIYTNTCAGCHGDPTNPDSAFGKNFYPPVPQFFKVSPDMPENENFYIIEHGIRWTGMPAWKGSLSDKQMWQVVTLLSHIDKLPPSVDKELRSPPSPTK